MPLTAPRTLTRFITFATIVLVVTVLRVAEDVTIPLALALLLAFLLSPLVVRLTRWVPNSVAIIATATLAFGVIGTVTWQITSQAVGLLEELPRYEENLRQKITALQKPNATSSLSRALATLEKMEADLLQPLTDSKPADGKAAPVPVEVRPVKTGPVQLAGSILPGLVQPFSVAGIVIVFVIAILFQREDLRNRFIRVISGGELNIATQAVDDAAQRVSRYLLAQLLVNTCFGIGIGVGLFFIGVPHAPLWGLLATVLRFIPFLGPVIAAAFPLLLGIAVDPGWSMLLWTALLFLVAELVTNNVIEVLAYGTSTGISTLALLTAAVFWSWLWGMPGLFLSTPLTVCLLVVGQYVPGLKFLGVLLGSEPPLSAGEQFYQRMLAMQQEDLFSAADDYLAHRSVTAFYDDVFVPALFMAEIDRHKGTLAEVRQKFILESGADLIEELAQRPRPATEEPLAPPPAAGVRHAVVGLPARDDADELIAQMLAHLLRDHGTAVELVPITASPDDIAARVRADSPTVFISALPPSTVSAAGRLCRRIKKVNPAARILVGVWGTDGNVTNLHARLTAAGADAIAHRLSDAVAQLGSMLAQPPEPAPPGPAPSPPAAPPQPDDPHELKPEDAIDATVRELARTFGVPAALASVVQTDREFWQSVGGGATLPPFGDAAGLEDVLVSDTFLASDDVAKDSRFSTEPALLARGVRFFASTPLRTRTGHRVGNLCVLDTQPRALSEDDRELLQVVASRLMAAVEPAETSTPGDERA